MPLAVPVPCGALQVRARSVTVPGRARARGVPAVSNPAMTRTAKRRASTCACPSTPPFRFAGAHHDALADAPNHARSRPPSSGSRSLEPEAMPEAAVTRSRVPQCAAGVRPTAPAARSPSARFPGRSGSSESCSVPTQPAGTRLREQLAISRTEVAQAGPGCLSHAHRRLLASSGWHAPTGLDFGRVIRLT